MPPHLDDTVMNQPVDVVRFECGDEIVPHSQCDGSSVLLVDGDLVYSGTRAWICIVAFVPCHSDDRGLDFSAACRKTGTRLPLVAMEC